MLSTGVTASSLSKYLCWLVPALCEEMLPEAGPLSKGGFGAITLEVLVLYFSPPDLACKATSHKTKQNKTSKTFT